jgi:16S rRNA (guanine966-N2)-methyltransferase
MAKAKHTIRIISGTHGSRRLPVLDIKGLRPTGDRVRETLFNWLQMTIAGKNVLDVCAGSGALGFEAASRGAKQVIMLDNNPRIASQLKITADALQFSNCQIVSQSAEYFLTHTTSNYDIIFIDPPFALGLIQDLTDNALAHININGFIYREAPIAEDLIKLPENWQLYRNKTLGQVKIELWKRIS